MNVETTDACNLACPSCLRPQSSKYMSLRDFEKIASTLYGAGIRQLSFHWRGEPTLHPQLPNMAEHAKKKGFKTWISTNTATPLLHNEDYLNRLLLNLDKIMACVDGYSQETLGKYRAGADFGTVMRNVEAIGGVKTKCLKDMRVLMFRYNDGHEDWFRELARENGFDRISFASPIINYHMKLSESEAEEWLSANPKYRRYRRIGGEWIMDRAEKCSPRPLVSVDGALHPCCNDWNLEYGLGSLLEEPFAKVWGRYLEFRPEMMAMRLPMCAKWCCLSSEGVDHREDV